MTGRHFRPKRILVGALVLVVMGAAANLLGWDISGWLSDLWDTLTEISPASVVVAVVLITVQTTATAYAWFSILRYGYPGGAVVWREVLACYAASVGLNCVLPANLGTAALLVMFATTIAGATFTGVLGGYVVQKIFYTVIGALVYVYLFLSVEGSFDIDFAWVHEHPWATAVLVVGGVALIAIVVRLLWPRVVKWWENAKVGGAILGNPGAFLLRVFVPELVSWVAMVCVIAVFLAAYSIPVTFHTLMSVVGGNSIANVTAVTPGGAGVNQAFNVASLNDVTSATTATAFSVAHQLVRTAWDILFAIVLLVWAFGWTGGKTLVAQSYAGAKEKAAEQKAARRAKKEAQITPSG